MYSIAQQFKFAAYTKAQGASLTPTRYKEQSRKLILHLKWISAHLFKLTAQY